MSRWEWGQAVFAKRKFTVLSKQREKQVNKNIDIEKYCENFVNNKKFINDIRMKALYLK